MPEFDMTGRPTPLIPAVVASLDASADRHLPASLGHDIKIGRVSPLVKNQPTKGQAMRTILPPAFRGSAERSGEWKPLAAKLVAELQYDHFSGERFRHGRRFLRWRPDKAPRQCVIGQVAQEAASTLALLGDPAHRLPSAFTARHPPSEQSTRKRARRALATPRRR